jgi:hypothetical protein
MFSVPDPTTCDPTILPATTPGFSYVPSKVDGPVVVVPVIPLLAMLQNAEHRESRRCEEDVYNRLKDEVLPI